MVWKGFVYLFAVYIYAFHLAFSTKMHYIWLQIAPNMVQIAVLCNVYSFCLHLHTTPFCIKTNLRENRFFAARWAIGEQKGTQNVKIYTENQTKKTIMPHTFAWSTTRKARTLTTAGKSGCRACCSQPTETTSWKHRSNLPLTTSFATYRVCITPNRLLNRLSNILSCYPLFSVLLSLACRLLARLILLT